MSAVGSVGSKCVYSAMLHKLYMWLNSQWQQPMLIGVTDWSNDETKALRQKHLLCRFLIKPALPSSCVYVVVNSHQTIRCRLNIMALCSRTDMINSQKTYAGNAFTCDGQFCQCGQDPSGSNRVMVELD